MADLDDVRELSGDFLDLRHRLDPEANLRPESRLRVPTAEQLAQVPKDINPRGYSKWPLERFVRAAHEGDVELLEKMLNREDPIDGYHHDFNEHHLPDGYNALHAAASAGQLEAVDMLLEAGLDPHVKLCMPEGRDPAEGETARLLADKNGWDDIVERLKKAEASFPRGLYKEFGRNNNAKLWPIDRPEGLDPEQEKRAKQKYKSMVNQIPNKVDRLFYGDLVYGVNFGMDARGQIIGKKQAPAVTAHDSLALADEPLSKCGLLFPGPGSQKVEMLSGAEKIPGVRGILDTARRVLGFDLQELCQQGSRDKLEKDMAVAGPAMMVASLAALEKLRAESPQAAERPGAVAGLFFGEFTALVVAGVLDLELGLQLVREAAEGVLEAANSSPQAMLSVAGLEEAKLRELCADAAARSGELCQIAIVLFPKGYTCSGSSKAVDELKRLVDGAGALQTKVLPTAAAVHTPLMAKARERLYAALQRALPHMKAPKCDVYMTSVGKVFRRGAEPRELLIPLCDQLASPVLWEASIRQMLSDGIEEFFEVGPGAQLKAMMKRIDAVAFGKMQSCEV
eukprot:TRINITY_DN81741_c0_g1_i1.p1 TRINITY_DN81741_c0_g1~~TRINITY_DN81741_c0_g1_i1.p1  ORF type:complete len:568 (+),score=174.39 TRINITY_DN81741_c0_g1_i1:51-1754(+)